MKNLFLSFNSGKSRENGRFLFNKEIQEVANENLKSFEIDKNEVVTVTSKGLLKTDMEVNKKKEKRKASSAGVGKEAENFAKKAEKHDSNETKELSPEELEQLGKEVAEASNVYFAPKIKTIAENTETTLEQKTEYTENLLANAGEVEEKTYLEHMGELFGNRIPGLPNDLDNWGKGAGVLVILGYINKEGTIKEKAKSALKWGAWTAFFTHPAITQTIAHTGKLLGQKVVAPTIVGVANAVSVAISNPREALQAIREALNTKSGTPIADLLMRNKTSANKVGEALATHQNPIYLWENGVNFSPELTEVIKAMDAFEEKKTAPSPQVIQKAAKFMAQSEEIKLSDAELAKFQGTLFNEEDLSLEDVRKTVVTTTRKAIQKFINEAGQQDDFNFKLAEMKEKLNLPAGAAGKIDEITTKNLEDSVITGVKNPADFAKMKEKIPQGIDAVFKSPGTSILKALIIIFLGINGVMKLKGLANTENYKKENMKKRAKKVGGWILWPFKAVLTPLAFLARGGKTKAKARRKKFAKIGKEEMKWTTGQQQEFSSMSKEEQNLKAKKFFDAVLVKEKGVKGKIKELKKKYKKDKSWWKRLTDGKNIKDDEDFKSVKEELKKISKFEDAELKKYFEIEEKSSNTN